MGEEWQPEPGNQSTSRTPDGLGRLLSTTTKRAGKTEREDGVRLWDEIAAPA